MDTAPKAIQPFILVTTALVVIGAGAIALLWMLVFDRRDAAPALPPGPAEADLRGVDFPARVPAAERERLRALGGRLVDPAEAARRAETADALVAAGRDALPVLLTGLFGLAADEKALATPASQSRFATIDAVLVRIRTAISPSEPAGPPPPLTDSSALLRRARLWFGWYARVERAA